MEPDDDKTRTHVVLTSGTMVSQYRIVEKIGAGGMGEVYLAEDTELKRKAALKFLPAHLCGDADFRARFKREAQAAAKLNHPNIVTIYEVGEYKNRPFIAMEFCRGETLRTKLKRSSITPEKATELAIEICEGLDKAHRDGVTHRDIKPANVAIDEEGHARLLDFGLAAVRGEEQITKTGSTMGTVGYISPEQIRGEDIDNRSDLFSFGVLFYEMITGQSPFKADNEATTLNAILNETPPPLSKFKADLPGQLQKIISRLLEKNPDNRYQSAAAVISDLNKLTEIQKSKAPVEPRKDWWNRYVVTTAVGILLIFAGYWIYNEYILKQQKETEPKRKMLAVLPFENLGAPEDEYFADGITDAINTRLASIHSLGVISRTSTMAYKNTKKRLPEIAKELGVDYILEGTILWDKSEKINRVRIIPQLIEVSTDTHLWSDEIDRNITDLFAVQSEIATRITEELGVTLREPERKLIQTKPTDNLEAYHYYLRAMEFWEEQRDSEKAVQMLEKAVELDPTFHLAYRKLAQFYGFNYINSICHNDSCYEESKKAAERAVELSGDNPNGDIAMGYFHYYCSRDYTRALELFEKALKMQPNNVDLLNAIGFVKRRQGHWEEALANLQKAYRLDPRNLATIDPLARTLTYMHRVTETRELIDKALVWAPANRTLLIWNMFLVAGFTQDSAKIRAALNRFDKAADHSIFNYWAEKIDIILRDYSSALNRRHESGNYMLSDSAEYYSIRGDLYSFLGGSETSREYYDSARIVCENRIKSDPDNAWFRINLATAYAGLGRKEDAIREGQFASELMPVSKDALEGSSILISLANIYVKTGEYEKAIDLLDYLLANPSMLQAGSLRLNPHFDPLRKNPRYKALLEKYDVPHN